MGNLRLFLANLGYRRPLHPLVTPPLGLMYLAAYLREKQSVSIKLCNQKLYRYSDKQLVREISAYRPHIIGLSAMTHSANSLEWITAQLREALPHSWIVVGGPHATALEKKLLFHTKAHVIVSGEGEIVFEKIVSAYPHLNDIEQIEGIITHNSENTSLLKKMSCPSIADLDTLPLPAYDLIDLRKYWREQSMPPIPRRKYLTLLSSRGCPFRCSYCHRIFGKQFRQHSADRMVDEIAYYQKKYHIDDFEFVDDIFNLNKSFVFDFCDALHRRNLKIKMAFPNGVRGDILTADVIHALADAGMYFCAFAIESGSSRVQHHMRKNLNIQRCLENICIAQKRGVYCHGFAMMGFPGETAKEMQMTIDVMANSCLHTASFFTVTPLPGSDLFNQVQKQYPELLDTIEYKEFSDVTINLSDVDDAHFLQVKRTALRQVMMNPKRIKRILIDFPQPYLLPLYFPEFIRRMTQGMIL
ncbi:MAG: B12-binding domain-containing radical SAM protein [Candidatus Magnetomorum sp.]|nr:B12-binding domain-containing radical SAM protein [Candidatus Magnetomorum sp.]